MNARTAPRSPRASSRTAADSPPETGGTLAVPIATHLQRDCGANVNSASVDAWMRATALACRDDLADRWFETQRADAGQRRVHYLSMEFLMGRGLANALSALELDRKFTAVADNASRSAGDILEREPDAALGNGGLGRLAACFLDSMATVGLPSFGYGLRYQYGMFAQRIRDGVQVETPDLWLTAGSPWEVPRPEVRFEVGFGGRVEPAHGDSRRWLPRETVMAEAYDFIVPGHGTRRVSTLRLWQARTTQAIDFAAFSRGDYAAAGRSTLEATALNWVLYPDDSTDAGRELRLKQEYLLVSASLQDIVARHLAEHGSLDGIGDHARIHLNDTHPALAVPELMRLLVDGHGLGWNTAWAECRRAVSYTNHTLLPEALETWPVRMFEALLPRHLEIIYRINHDFLAEVRSRFPGDEALVQRVSLIDEQGERRIKMAALAIVASHQINGVSKLHSELMVDTIFADYARLYPERFCNVTNGVTPRRWLAQANPALSGLIDSRLGKSWRLDLDRLHDLLPLAEDAGFRTDFLAAKRANKERLAERIRRDLGLRVNPDALFDVQVKRIHEYKRQLLNVLQVVARYQTIVSAPQASYTPRVVVFAGKAASAYVTAKTIIRLIHDVARVVNSDPRVADRLQVAFLPDYSVSLAETIMPAADLSEQISTAGTEASGTGNMKFAMNGALTIGTWDGANIEMAEAIGKDHLFIFGLDANQVATLKHTGYDPRLHYQENPHLKAALDAIAGGQFSPGEPDRYKPLVDSLLHRDTYLLLADFASYVATQAQVDRLYHDPQHWADKAIRNIAGMGTFSADRTIREYAEKIWGIQPQANG